MRIAVVSKAKETSHNICLQLKQLLGDEIEVEEYCIDHGIQTDFKDRLVVITSHLLKNYVVNRLHPGTKFVIARRSINYHFLNKLIAIQAGTEVMLINDVEETCMEAISQLKELGIDHIQYYPYYLGIDEYKELGLAVTPGESHLAPRCVKEIIDIGTRLIDITTLVEILMHVGTLEEKGNLISSQFVRNIIDLSKQYNKVATEAIELKNVFQAIVENSSDGIVYLNTSGFVLEINDVFLEVVLTDKDAIKGKSIYEVLPELKELMNDQVESQIVKLRGRKLVVTKTAVMRENNIFGYLITIKDATQIQNMEYELRRKMRRQEHNATYSFRDIIGTSEAIEKTIKLSRRLAISDSTILIQGESGTGKEFFAQAIHSVSNRRNGPFVPVNFAALPASLLESELFGYEEGAFTGARKGGKSGLFEEAHGGTIFLDEIGDAPLELQVRLLRVLQEKEVRRVGGTKRIPIDVRVISATNKELRQLVGEGVFRKDLYYRLNVLTLFLPTLRERREDIPILLETYIRRHNNKTIQLKDFFSDEALNFLFQYEWAGNVRELVNVVEYLIHIKEDGKVIQIDDLPGYIINELDIKNSLNISSIKSYGYCLDSEKDYTNWILMKAWENNGIGRRKLAKIAERERLNITEAKIRKLLNEMERDGLLQLSIGAKGALVTKKGLEIINGK
ncbi:sigma-54 interaction domain-containing protein [Anaerosolibacter sp.]|uniref:sigma-54 interaction domain-containing protein n=1 Tax=Anaerosolibacter sp. TaxID=1872527 RepID=UPI0039EF6068